jgi:CheY-like chemotaxis protein
MTEKLILVVDDDESWLKALGLYFKNSGLSIKTLSQNLTVENVEAEIASLKPDLVVTDLDWTERQIDEGRTLFQHLGQLSIASILYSNNDKRLQQIKNIDPITSQQRVIGKQEQPPALIALVKELLGQ